MHATSARNYALRDGDGDRDGVAEVGVGLLAVVHDGLLHLLDLAPLDQLPRDVLLHASVHTAMGGYRSCLSRYGKK